MTPMVIKCMCATLRAQEAIGWLIDDYRIQTSDWHKRQAMTIVNMRFDWSWGSDSEDDAATGDHRSMDHGFMVITHVISPKLS